MQTYNTSQASWVEKMAERIHNIITTDTKKSKEVDNNEEMPTPKREKSKKR